MNKKNMRPRDLASLLSFQVDGVLWESFIKKGLISLDTVSLTLAYMYRVNYI
jgi:hypothetical protein